MIISENIFVKYAYGASCGNGKLEERNDYYPFGGLMGKGLNGDFQSYKYNGKELERQIGLDIYDYGARRYDAATCRDGSAGGEILLHKSLCLLCE
ncbi:hypothetical protein [Prevotella sp. OH937_COT-195]|uniref:hypothetical protein n=1 Tax=Prevotella sp. OH937_COT-195 TaxID=2491051 RepID=UPI000F653F42|nr:hypothetical protein [Prevotella sp. OH937_COT-195]RRC97013.1 hypothetical protein EII32_10800 [Prevotella sp. OH937_COT-195]